MPKKAVRIRKKPKSRGSKGGRPKGINFEIEICKKLSLWLTKGKRDDIFWRAAASGARATSVLIKKGKNIRSQAGDITAVDKLGQPFTDTFFIECKNDDNLKYHGLITEEGQIYNFWIKACEQSEKHNKLPMLIAKQSYHTVVMCVTEEGLDLIEDSSTLDETIHVLYSPLLEMFILIFDDFIEYIDPDSFIKSLPEIVYH